MNKSWMLCKCKTSKSLEMAWEHIVRLIISICGMNENKLFKLYINIRCKSENCYSGNSKEVAETGEI